jgi:hypothetical protein
MSGWRLTKESASRLEEKFRRKRTKRFVRNGQMFCFFNR